MSPDTESEIRGLVEAALARYGTAGTVHVDPERVVLAGHGPTASVPIVHLLARWEGLPLAERQRECWALARALARERRAAVGGAPKRRGRPSWLLAWGGLLLGSAAVYWRFSPEVYPRSAVAPQPGLSEAARAEQERRERAHRVCDAARTRLARGATLGPSDAEGWVVELAFVRPAIAAPWASLATFLTHPDEEGGRHVVWAGAPDLAELKASGTRVAVSERLLPEGAPRLQNLVLTFYGEYVLPYLRERERIRLIRFAHALGEHQSATLGALYARCGEGATHHMGSWFLGSSPGAAMTSLLYFMDAHAEARQLPREVVSDQANRELVPEFALPTLLELTRRLERREVGSMLASHDGMVAGPRHFTTLAFPFVDSDGALRASHELARDLTSSRR